MSITDDRRNFDQVLADIRNSVSRVQGEISPSGTFSVQDPATLQDIADVVDYPVDAADSFLETAVKSQRGWESESPRTRSQLLATARDLLIDRSELFAATITAEMGKPLAESRAEVRFTADYIEWFAGEALRSDGNYREAPNGGARLITSKRAVGVALLITAWNFPLVMGARKLAAALAAGCSAILKPAAETPLTSLLLAEVFADAGLPSGVLQVVTTSDAAAWSARLMADPRLRKVSFTGSTRVGSRIIEQSAPHIQSLSLELGGDAPFIVFDDADLEAAVEQAVVAKIRNGGQACVAANRFLVQDGIAPDFIREFVSRLQGLRVGDGFAEDSELGPLISEKAVLGASALLEDALGHGATVELEGGGTSDTGHFFRPALIRDASGEAMISRSEIFAPIAAVRTFTQASEAIELANDSPYGLAGFVFSQDIDRAFSVAHALHTGVLGINKGLAADATSEFGGTGYSGFGREGGVEGMADFQVTRMFNLNMAFDV